MTERVATGAERSGWQLVEPTEDEIGQLSECWSVDVADLLDPDRVWLQAVGDGDVAGPRVVDLASRRIAIYPRPGRPEPRWTHRLIGLRGLLRLSRDPVMPTGALRVLGPQDQPEVDALLATCSPQELQAVDLRPAIRLSIGCWFGTTLAAVCSLVEVPAGPPKTSLLTHADYRQRGVAGRVVAALVGAAPAVTDWIQHHTTVDNIASQHIAHHAGFRLLTVEHLVMPAEA